MFALALIVLVSAEIKVSPRAVFSQRSQKYFYPSTALIEEALKPVNKTDKDALNIELMLDDAAGDPLNMNLENSDLFCISNTVFAALFTTMTFCSACAVVIGIQLMSYAAKEQRKQEKNAKYRASDVEMAV